MKISNLIALFALASGAFARRSRDIEVPSSDSSREDAAAPMPASDTADEAADPVVDAVPSQAASPMAPGLLSEMLYGQPLFGTQFGQAPNAQTDAAEATGSANSEDANEAPATTANTVAQGGIARLPLFGGSAARWQPFKSGGFLAQRTATTQDQGQEGGETEQQTQAGSDVASQGRFSGLLGMLQGSGAATHAANGQATSANSVDMNALLTNIGSLAAQGGDAFKMGQNSGNNAWLNSVAAIFP